MSFLDQLRKETNEATTLNGAKTNKSSLNPVLDFFAQAGAMRDRKDEAVKMFKRAYAEDPLTALRTAFYLRDIRGGQGERDLFRAFLAEVPHDVVAKNLKFIPEFGRFDDLFTLDIPEVSAFIREQLAADVLACGAGESVSLLAKWMPSENASSKESKKLAQKFARELGLSAKTYRTTIVKLRKHIKLLEQQMSQNEWATVDYEHTPSQAMRKHVKAFKKHDETRYTEFLAAVEKGEKKIKATTLFTYEVFDLVKEGEDATANAMWKSLPDYTNGANALVVADVSGSMIGRPMSISVSLALYFAEHNTGTFKDYFMTFSAKPELVKVVGSTLTEKLSFIESLEWGMNTDVEAAFDAILQAAIKSGSKGDDMPKVLYIISDMEFDACTEGDSTNFEAVKAKFEAVGFKLPHLVFWNVNAKTTQTAALYDSENVTLISGSSQSTFQYAVAGKTPEESMNDILNSERYAVITI